MVSGRHDEEAGHPALGVQFKGEGDTGKGPRKCGDAATRVGVGDWRGWGRGLGTGKKRGQSPGGTASVHDWRSEWWRRVSPEHREERSLTLATYWRAV